ncbi:MAG: YceH family protein [Thiobacillaceae bacterium]
MTQQGEFKKTQYGAVEHNALVASRGTAMTAARLPVLSLLETRVLGVLYEKQHTVPDTYPLSLNALVAGCNQKTSRYPLMEVAEAEVQAAIDSLKGPALVMESSGGRVPRFAHNMERVLRLPSQSLALLTVLMLRGTQTAGELRINCDRLHKFADISAVEGFLQELAERPEGAMVMELPRQPGSRENRWAHLLSGPHVIEEAAIAAAPAAEPGGDITMGEIAAVKANLARLEAEVDALKNVVGKICAELGISA